jgi:hypothetical protein
MDLADKKKRKYQDIEPWEFYAHFNARSARRNGSYISMLDNWLRIFPEEQLLIAFFEDIRDRPQELLIKIFRHLNLSRDVDWSAFPYRERFKEGRSVSFPDEYRETLQRLYMAEIEAVAARLGGPSVNWS